MDNNFILEKTYSVPADIFREALRSYQKKFVYPKSWIFTAIYLVLTANFVYGAVKASDNFLAYIMITVCLALAFREWYNPRKMRMAVMDAVHDMDGIHYRFSVGNGFIEFSTIEHGEVENSEEIQDVPPSRISINDNLGILEYDRFFLVIDGKSMFYVIPKESFSDTELNIIRNLNN